MNKKKDHSYSSSISSESDEKDSEPYITQAHSRQLLYSRVEKKRVKERINGFNWKECEAWKYLCERFGSHLNQKELISIAELIASKNHLKLDRDAKRRKVVLIKWFQENWEIVKPLLLIITLD